MTLAWRLLFGELQMRKSFARAVSAAKNRPRRENNDDPFERQSFLVRVLLVRHEATAKALASPAGSPSPRASIEPSAFVSCSSAETTIANPLERLADGVISCRA